MLINSIRYRFRGINLVRTMESSRNKKVSQIANALSRNADDVYEFTRSSSNRQIDFMQALVDKYRWDTFESKTSKPEDKILIDKLVTSVINPKKLHIDLVNNFKGSMNTLARIFDAVQNQKSRLNFVNKMYQEVIKGNNNAYENLIPEILESRYSNEIVKNFDKYKSYFILNVENKFAVKILVSLLKNRAFNKESYDLQLKHADLKKQYPILKSKFFTPEVYAEKHTEERADIIESLIKNCYINHYDIPDDESQELVKLYTTTTEDNYKIRKKIIDFYPETHKESPTRHEHLIQELNRLFETIENDKNAKKFVLANMQSDTGINTISEYNRIFACIPPKKLYQNIMTAIQIIRNNSYNPKYIEILQREVSATTGNDTSNTFLQDIVGTIKNLLRKITRQNAQTTKQIQISLPEPVVAQQVVPIVQPTQPLVQQTIIIETTVKTVETPKQKENKPSLAKLRKTQLKEKVSTFITKKLGAKTLADQEIDYTKYATKMRFDMLPEIFASIAETRKADKIAGKKKSLSSNMNAVELFKMINGKNKKFINYLLKKRNSDGTRMFEVKEIIDILENTEQNIRLNKKENAGFNGKQIKKYYDGLLEEKIQQFGKIQRTRKLDKQA